MSTLAIRDDKCQDIEIIEQVLMEGDLSRLTSMQRVTYYNRVCQSVGLNPLTRPLDYLRLNGKMVLYAKKDATEQLRRLNGVSIEGLEDKVVDDIYIVTARAKTKDGRTDESKGAVSFAGLKGDAKANAIMKAETKAKRRVTLSISGMGFLDETEIDSIPGAKLCNVDMETGEIKEKIQVLPAIEQKKEEVSKQLTSRKITEVEAVQIYSMLDKCHPDYKKWFFDSLDKKHATRKVFDLPFTLYEGMKNAVTVSMNEHQNNSNPFLAGAGLKAQGA
jgi:hypothetical protein